MTNREDILHWIVQLERKYPVHKWRIGSIWIWPLVRKQLATLLVRKIDGIRDEESFVSETSVGRRLGRVIYSVWRTLSVLFMARPARFLFSGKSSHRVDFKGTSYNRYFEPLMDHAELKGWNSVLVDYSKVPDDSNFFRRDRVVLLADFVPFFRFIGTLPWVKRSFEMPDYNRFIEDIGRNEHLANQVSKFAERTIRREIDKVELYARIYRFLIRRFRCEAVFGLCYYNREMLGMNLAASQCEVISIDMQHGGQGPLHFAYASWGKHPSNGYNLLPNIFWVWDEVAAATIRQWAASTSSNCVIVGGNPWITELMHEDLRYQMPSNVILYTMQPMGELLDSYIIDAINATKDKYVWWLRLHPRQISEKGILVELLRKNGLINYVNLEEAFSLPLPYILSKAIVHISKYSGSIQESVMMGTPTIITHPIGEKAFRSYLDSGLALAALSENSCELINKINDAVTMKWERHFVDFRSAFDQVLLPGDDSSAR